LIDLAASIGPFLTVLATVFVLELTDKDALLLFSLATSRSARLVFAAGVVAFTFTSAVIVLVGTTLVDHVPILWVKVTGGGIMLAYAVWTLVKAARDQSVKERAEKRILDRGGTRELYAFLAIVSSLALLDLAGDATELAIIVFVAQYRNILLVFTGAVVALVVASGVEAALGNRMGRWMSARGARYMPAVVLLIVGTLVVVTSTLGA
jgi:putative Ca2+/H+ antiporter (TMEM165/GDT1 family)